MRRAAAFPSRSISQVVRVSRTKRSAAAFGFRRLATTEAAGAQPRFDWGAIAEEKGQGWPKWLADELRSDHAGETGAVWIYKGAMAAMQFRSTSAQLLHRFTGLDICPYRKQTEEPAWQFVQQHLATESEHLVLMEDLVPPGERSSLIPIWKLAGFTLGALPTLAWPTPTWLYVTIEAVETFVEMHYLNHIQPLEEKNQFPELTRLLRHCCEEEVHHRDDAAERSGMLPGAEAKPFPVRVWFAIVAGGSQAAVELAKRI
mmetsp:Transcript_17623/g.33465  ORF Transcript_17623/g.33465 Transcript_17623/m.33465 type:complete len:259 (-) Transcript_17623:426-1202(-)